MHVETLFAPFFSLCLPLRIIFHFFIGILSLFFIVFSAFIFFILFLIFFLSCLFIVSLIFLIQHILVILLSKQLSSPEIFININNAIGRHHE